MEGLICNRTGKNVLMRVVLLKLKKGEQVRKRLNSGAEMKLKLSLEVKTQGKSGTR